MSDTYVRVLRHAVARAQATMKGMAKKPLTAKVIEFILLKAGIPYGDSLVFPKEALEDCAKNLANKPGVLRAWVDGDELRVRARADAFDSP